MNETLGTRFDCVQSMRRIRDGISQEIAEMSYDQLARWLRSHDYSDPVLKRLAERAAHQAHRVNHDAAA